MIKDLLVHLEGNQEDNVRLAYAELIAKKHDAFVTGLFCNIVPENIYAAGDGSMMAARAASQMQDAAIEFGDKTEARLRGKLDKIGTKTELRRLDLTSTQAGHAVAAEARTTDLMIATRPYNHHSASPELLEAVLFNSGRGVLFVPPAIKPKGDIDQVVIAWRNTRESARAVSEAMPILMASKNVTVAMVAEKNAPESEGEMPGADIARHLDRHDVNVEIRQISGWSNPAEALLNEVEKTNSKMLVMGGYGHSRFREWVLGGVTRDILSTAEIPVLLCH